MPKCHVSGNYVEWSSDCADCRTRSCPINTGFAEDPLPDDALTLAQKASIDASKAKAEPNNN